MAAEMALILEAVEGKRGEGVRGRALKGFWGLVVLSGIGVLLGMGYGFWASEGAWRWLIVGIGGLLLGGLGYLAWRGYQHIAAYREQVELEAREAVLQIEGRYKALVQYASDIFLVLGRDRRVLYASPSIERNLGYKPGQVEGAEVSELTHPEDRALLEGALERGSSAFFTVRLQHREGYWRYFEGIGQPLFQDPMIRGYLVTLRDVTDRKREEAQRQAKEAAALRLAVEKERAEYERNLIEQSRRQLEEAYRIIEAKNRQIEESLQYAARIQQGMVAPMELIRRYVPESFVFWRPRDIVSGDFYWFYGGDGYFYLAAADCTGHGVPGGEFCILAAAGHCEWGFLLVLWRGWIFLFSGGGLYGAWGAWSADDDDFFGDAYAGGFGGGDRDAGCDSDAGASAYATGITTRCRRGYLTGWHGHRTDAV